MTTTPTPAERGLPELNVSWSDHFARQGDMAMSHNHVAFKAAESWILANMSALSRPLPSDWVADGLVLIDKGAVKLVENVLRRAQKDEVADAMLSAIGQAMMKAAPSAPAEAVQTAPEPLAQSRDREEDRERFPDQDLNAWPDATAIECSSDLHDCPVNPSVTGYTRAEAITAWNTRPALLAMEDGRHD